MITSDELLTELLKENRSIKDIVKKEFTSISFDALNYSPGKNRWSIAECFDHIIVTNNQYIPLIKSKLLENGSSDEGKNKEFNGTIAGRFMIYSLTPGNHKKLKAPRIFRPDIKIYTKEVIKFFLDQNNLIYNLMNESRGKDLVEIKIQSPVTKLLRYNLGEVYRIINVHELRHLDQARRILEQIP